MKRDERTSRHLLDERSDGVCEVCGNQMATNAHHRKNRSQGGTWAASNLLAVCGSGTTGCHGRITEHVDEAVLMGWACRSYQDPAATSVRTRHGRVMLTDAGGIEAAK